MLRAIRRALMAAGPALAVALLVPSVALADAAPGTVVQEDFSNGLNANQWKVLSGNWAATNGALAGKSIGYGTTNEADIYLIPTTFKRPFSISLDVAFDSATGDVNQHGGFIVSQVEGSRLSVVGYEFDFLDQCNTCTNNNYRFVRLDGDGVSDVLKFMPAAALQVGRFYHWQVAFDVSTVSFRVDGTFLGSVSDTTYGAGLHFGLWTYHNQNQVRFDNVLIEVPEGGGGDHGGHGVCGGSAQSSETSAQASTLFEGIEGPQGDIGTTSPAAALPQPDVIPLEDIICTSDGLGLPGGG